MKTQHVLATSEHFVLDNVGVLYITNSLVFGEGRRVLGSDDVEFEVDLLGQFDSLDQLESRWPEPLEELEMALDDLSDEQDCLHFLLLEQDAAFAFDVEAPAGLTIERLEDGMDWDLQFEADSDEQALLSNVTLHTSPGTLTPLE